MPYIQVIQPEEAQSPLKEIYEHLIKTRGKLAEVHKILSLHPEAIQRQMDLYMTVMYGRSPLTRAQREMISVVVSSANDCEYCKVHHGAALNFFWKDAKKTEQLRKDYTKADLSPQDKLLCEYAWNLTRIPGKINEREHIQPLKDAGFSDRQILDATLVISYFNFINRIVTGLGAELETDGGEGYKYGEADA